MEIKHMAHFLFYSSLISTTRLITDKMCLGQTPFVATFVISFRGFFLISSLHLPSSDQFSPLNDYYSLKGRLGLILW